MARHITILYINGRGVVAEIDEPLAFNVEAIKNKTASLTVNREHYIIDRIDDHYDADRQLTQSFVKVVPVKYPDGPPEHSNLINLLETYGH